MSPYDFILNSQEFQVFTRPKGDIDKTLSGLPKETTTAMVEKYRAALKIEEHLYDPIQKDKLDT